jgi:hypothetical protein
MTALVSKERSARMIDLVARETGIVDDHVRLAREVADFDAAIFGLTCSWAHIARWEQRTRSHLVRPYPEHKPLSAEDLRRLELLMRASMSGGRPALHVV